MNTIADLVAKHRDYCAKFRPHWGVIHRYDGDHFVDMITIERYNWLVSKHLTMTVNKIKHLSQRG